MRRDGVAMIEFEVESKRVVYVELFRLTACSAEPVLRLFVVTIHMVKPILARPVTPLRFRTIFQDTGVRHDISGKVPPSDWLVYRTDHLDS